MVSRIIIYDSRDDRGAEEGAGFAFGPDDQCGGSAGEGVLLFEFRYGSYFIS
jgi:hypothetical protein